MITNNSKVNGMSGCVVMISGGKQPATGKYVCFHYYCINHYISVVLCSFMIIVMKRLKVLLAVTTVTDVCNDMIQYSMIMFYN